MDRSTARRQREATRAADARAVDQQHDSADALKAALHKHIADHYALIGQAEYEQGSIGPAIVLLEEAKTYAPADAEIEKLLTEAKSKAEKKSG